MKNIPIIFALILAIAWWYTSWYWYVCNIKWLCNASISSQENIITVDDTIIDTSPNVEETKVDKINVQQDENILTADDVLSSDIDNDSSEIKEEAIIEEEIQKEIPEEVKEESPENEWEKEDATEVVTICTNPLEWPIAFGAQNDAWEVELLETFLISRWEELNAVKRFQIEYRSEILDPWGIQNPTWYVYTTTVKTINEIACK